MKPKKAKNINPLRIDKSNVEKLYQCYRFRYLYCWWNHYIRQLFSTETFTLKETINFLLYKWRLLKKF